MEDTSLCLLAFTVTNATFALNWSSFDYRQHACSFPGHNQLLVALFFYFSFLLVVLIDHPVLPQTVSAVRAKVMRAVSCPSQSMSPWLAPDELWAGPGPCTCSLCLPSARPWPHSLAPVPFLATRAGPEPGNQAGLVFRLPVPAHYCAYSSLSRLLVISLSLLDCSHPLPLLAHW